MVVDLTGGLAGVKRHDYLPFGEELFAGTGGRTPQHGYYADGVRQKFTEQERDAETGLDYFINRYYSSTLGRFTSPDPLSLTSQRKTDPQMLNLYAYARNNPVLLTDPNGLELYVYGTAAEIARFISDLEQLTGLKFDVASNGRVTIAKNSPKPKTAEANRIAGIIGDLSNRVEAYVMRGDNPKYGGKNGIMLAVNDGYGSAAIDYDDVDKFSAKSKGTTPLDIIYHEIIEAYEFLTNAAAKKAMTAGDKKKAHEIAHKEAIDATNMYRKRVGLPARGDVTTEGPILDAQGNNLLSATGDARYSVDYTTHTEYWTVNVNTQNKLKSVQVVKKQ